MIAERRRFHTIPSHTAPVRVRPESRHHSLMTETVLFVCQHGAAKSVIAAEYLTRLAQARGLDIRGESRGLEPDECVPAPVVEALAREGFDVGGYAPRPLGPEHLSAPQRVIALGCELGSAPGTSSPVEEWSDIPMVSDGYATARDAIVARVERLVDEIAADIAEYDG